MVVSTVVVFPIVEAIADWKAHSLYFLDHLTRPMTLTQQIRRRSSYRMVPKSNETTNKQ